MVAVDAAPDMVAAARARGLDARVMAGQNLAFDGEFDAVFSNAALHWMRPPEAVLAGVRRALKPGGRFVGEMGGHNNTAAIMVALSAVLAAAGSTRSASARGISRRPPPIAHKLEAAGFAVDADRHRPAPDAAAGRDRSLARHLRRGFLRRPLPDPDRAPARAEVVELLRPILIDETGTWIADYVRLRFRAMRAG